MGGLQKKAAVLNLYATFVTKMKEATENDEECVEVNRMTISINDSL